MKRVFVSILVLFATLSLSAQTLLEKEVQPTFYGRNIYLGPAVVDLPPDLNFFLADVVCQIQGFDSAANGEFKTVSLDRPLEVAVPIKGEERPRLKLMTIDPKGSPSIVVIEKLTCWAKK